MDNKKIIIVAVVGILVVFLGNVLTSKYMERQAQGGE